ncbi:MAG: hypothetical protein LLF76_05795 [Planctomycetaceae bacterium]|nr:hypothetical protein [Planctomycetaceae bacterium]
MNEQPKIGVFKYSCCAGCEFQLIYFQKHVIDMFEKTQITYCRMLQSGGHPEGPFDVALIEGAITEQWQADQLNRVRAVSRYLIPIGSCAVCGGVPAIKNTTEEQEIEKRVYTDTSLVHSMKTGAINDYVKIDGAVKGCPMGVRDLSELVISLLLDKRPEFVNCSVCVECKLAANICVLVAYNEPCMGPVTNAGCGALCPGHHRACYGCWGPMEDANAWALAGQFRLMGLTNDDIHRKFTEFGQPTTQWKAGQIK